LALASSRCCRESVRATQLLVAALVGCTFATLFVIFGILHKVKLYLGGDESVISPAAAASAFCLLRDAALLRYLYHVDRARK
jgi:hypothetical protein